MKDFESLYSKTITPLVRSIFSNPYAGGVLEIDHNLEFKGRVKARTGLDIDIQKRKFNNNFPQLASYGCGIRKANLSVQAGSSEVCIGNGPFLSTVKARGEFLERLSSLFPLKAIISNDFSPASIAKNMPSHLFAKKLFSFGYKKVHSAQVYYGLFGQNKKELFKVLGYQATTNGGAGHFDYTTAVLNGLLELIQRDAFLVYWLNTVSPKQIDVRSYLGKQHPQSESLEELTKIVSDFNKYKLQYHFLDITSDIAVPTVCCVLISDSPTGKRMALGAGSGFNDISPLISAATEATSVLNSIFFKEPLILKKNYRPFMDASIRRDARLQLYTTDEMVDRAKFFFSNPLSISVDDWLNISGNDMSNNPKKGLDYLKKIFKARMDHNPTYEVSVYQIKNSLLKYFDYIVVRVFCKALYSLYLDENLADPQHPRLAEFVKNKDLEANAKLNPWPHPFP